jgi:ribosomal-protein-alanine N-acetyltransferase
MSSEDKNTTCRLRPFRRSDLPHLVRLDRRCFSAAIAYDRFEMVYHLTAPRHICLLAVPIAGGPPPLLGFVIAAAGRTGGEGQIITIDVDPDARRRGVGRLLLEAAEEQLAAYGNREVRLQVAEDNAGAREFYQGHGYTAIGLRPDYYPDGTDAVEMVKRIT